MELHEALAQISAIRTHIARTETFRGYRSATVGFSGLLALAGAAVQASWVPNPAADIRAYLILWVGIAGVCLVVVATELGWRCYVATSPLTREITWLAVKQFLPCIAAGGLLTCAMVRFAEEGLWMLPGLWAMLFSLGIFASCRLLPKATFWSGVYYLVAGVAALAFAQGDAAFSPWAMAGTFGLGQLLTAGILYYTLERPHAEP
jgi:hypothetical protein